MSRWVTVAFVAATMMVTSGCGASDDEADELYKVDTGRQVYVDAARAAIEDAFDTPELQTRLCADGNAAAALSDGLQDDGYTVEIVQEALDEVCR